MQVVTATAMAVAGQAVTVVVGAAAAAVMPMLARMGAGTVVNHGWREGMAASIRAGLAAVPSTSEAVLLMLGDQVEVTADDLKRLIGAWNGQDGIIAASFYQQSAGVPAIFPRWCFRELAELRGDRGAKLIIQRHAYRTRHVAMPTAAIDIDTPEDIARYAEVPAGREGLDLSAQTWLTPAGLELLPDVADGPGEF